MNLKISELIAEGRRQLEIAGKNDAAIDARLLGMMVLGCNSAKLLMIGNDLASEEVIARYLELIAKRAEGIPLQYITNDQPFMGLDFYVDENVLIPRQDTEVLVETIIERHAKHPLQKGVEIGVGSGCISVSLTHYIPELSITAMDICEKALAVAKKNVQSNGVENRVTLKQSDIFSNYIGEENTLDLIVSNPPYITFEECTSLMSEVKDYEPRKALTDEGDGLRFYRDITKDGKRFLKRGGLLAYEIGYLQGESVKVILEQSGFECVEIIKDLAGKDRVVIGIKQ